MQQRLLTTRPQAAAGSFWSKECRQQQQQQQQLTCSPPGHDGPQHPHPQRHVTPSRPGPGHPRAAAALRVRHRDCRLAGRARATAGRSGRLPTVTRLGLLRARVRPACSHGDGLGGPRRPASGHPGRAGDAGAEARRGLVVTAIIRLPLLPLLLLLLANGCKLQLLLLGNRRRMQAASAALMP